MAPLKASRIIYYRNGTGRIERINTQPTNERSEPDNVAESTDGRRDSKSGEQQAAKEASSMNRGEASAVSNASDGDDAVTFKLRDGHAFMEVNVVKLKFTPLLDGSSTRSPYVPAGSMLSDVELKVTAESKDFEPKMEEETQSQWMNLLEPPRQPYMTPRQLSDMRAGIRMHRFMEDMHFDPDLPKSDR